MLQSGIERQDQIKRAVYMKQGRRSLTAQCSPKTLTAGTMLLMRCWRVLASLVAAGALCVSAEAMQFHEREVFIPWTDAAPQGLSALLVYADLPDKEPLAVLTHGTSRQPQARNEVSPWALL